MHLPIYYYNQVVVVGPLRDYLLLPTVYRYGLRVLNVLRGVSSRDTTAWQGGRGCMHDCKMKWACVPACQHDDGNRSTVLPVYACTCIQNRMAGPGLFISCAGLAFRGLALLTGPQSPKYAAVDSMYGAAAARAGDFSRECGH